MASPLIAAGRRRAAAWSRVPFVARSSAARAAAYASSAGDTSGRAERTTARAAADVATDTADAGTRTGGYPFADIEAKWQKHWLENKTFATPSQVDTSKPKFYALDMFPYPRCARLRPDLEVSQDAFFPSAPSGVVASIANPNPFRRETFLLRVSSSLATLASDALSP